MSTRPSTTRPSTTRNSTAPQSSAKSEKKNGNVQLVYASNGSTYGNIQGRVLRKNVNASRHFLRKPPAIAIERYVMEGYAADFDSIEVKDRETGDLYTVTRAVAHQRGFDPHRGYEPQVAEPLSCWTRCAGSSRPAGAQSGQRPAQSAPPPPKPAPPPVAPIGPLPATGSLFD